MGGLNGRVALISGAGSGIGRCAALLFAADGAAVGALDADADAARATADAVTAAGGRAVDLAVDVRDAAAVADAVDTTVAAFGRLDVLYNNAGVSVGGSVLDATDDDWERCWSVNVLGTVVCTRSAVPRMAGGGAIVNTASIAAQVGVRGLAAYTAAKGAIIALTRSMAVDLAPLGIRVNAVAPGTVVTPMSEELLLARGGGDREAGIAATVPKYPLGRLGTPEEIAGVALFLAGPGAGFVTGTTVTADGGMTAQ
jgi:NAD(P)-dependent dehydrogenase (short-subunit alcohol dehydrogenase family)